MTDDKLRPIPTRYAGCHFRSRLEARWAVYFDARKWPWEYEPEGFQLPSGWYLPDFRVRVTPMCYCYGECLPRLEWFEIKGAEPTEREIRLAIELAEASRMQITMLGKVPRPGTTERGWRARSFHYYLPGICLPEDDLSDGLARRGTMHPHYFEVDGGGDDRRREDSGLSEADWIALLGPGRFRDRDMRNASMAALSARFEHGESGRT
jgi:hypothetical protein